MTISANYYTDIDYSKYDTSTLTIPDEENEAVFGNSGSEEFVGDLFSSSNECTDGNDDGKIGLGSIAANLLKGVKDTAVNAVKGCFLDEEGNFSLGRTLKTVAIGALCVACPAVGVAACAIGAVSGAVQIGKGVYGAVTADTDAEAKEAWQNIGGGALTAGVSIAGAKASYGAMKNSSTAGALDALGEDASLGAKAKAFVTDAKSSTINNTTELASSTARAAGKAAGKVYAAGEKAAGAVKNAGSASGESGSSLSGIGKSLKEFGTNVAKEAKEGFEVAKAGTQSGSEGAAIQSAEGTGAAAQGSAGAEVSASAKSGIHPLKTAGKIAVSAGKTAKGAAVATGKAAIGTVKAAANAASTLSKGAQGAYRFMAEQGASFSEAVQKYGYESAVQAMSAIAGTEMEAGA